MEVVDHRSEKFICRTRSISKNTLCEKCLRDLRHFKMPFRLQSGSGYFYKYLIYKKKLFSGFKIREKHWRKHHLRAIMQMIFSFLDGFLNDLL
jgi:hypothetical protein